MNWKKSLLVSASILAMVSTEQVIQACSDYNNYDTYPQFFGNEISNKPAFKPFQFIVDDLYYDGEWWYDDYSYGSTSDQINKRLILEEWQTFAGKGVELIDIDSALYGTQSDLLFSSLEKKEKLTEEWQKNSFVNFISEKKQKHTLAYLQYAKLCEINALADREEWSDDSQPKATMTSNQELNSIGTKLYKNIDQPFLKMKCAFQLIRNSFYAKSYEEVQSLYKDLVEGKEDRSVACTRNMGFKAGAFYRTNQKPEAGYWYSKMFDNSDAYKYDAMVSFEWSCKHYDEDNNTLIENRFSKILALCQTDHERAVAYTMKGLRTVEYDLEDIKKAYAFDPKVRGIDVLMNREINKLESDYFSVKTYAENQLKEPKLWYNNIRNYEYELIKNQDSLNRIYQPQIAAISSFASLLIQENKTGTASMWHLTKAYLSGMQDRPQEMQAELASAKQAGMTKNETVVYEMVNLLSTLYQNQRISPAVEQAILPQLNALNERAKTSSFANYQFRDVMRHVVAGKYFQQGDTAKGIFAMAHSDSWDTARATFNADLDFQDMQGEVLASMSIPSLNKVQDFRNSGTKSAFEQWLVNNTNYTPAVLKELEGTIYLRDYDFKNAVSIFEKIGENAQETFANPFMPQINDYIEIYPQDTQRTFTKLSFSKRMLELQQIIAKNPSDAGAIYGYAVALYNISYYGKSADMVAYNRIATDDRGYYKDNDDASMVRGLQEYYRVYTAEQYFNKAAAASADVELRAKALWGAAKCWTKRSPWTTNKEHYSWNFDDSYYQNGLKNPYFAKLNQSYSKTKFMEKVTGTCEYYSNYLSKN